MDCGAIRLPDLLKLTGFPAPREFDGIRRHGARGRGPADARLSGRGPGASSFFELATLRSRSRSPDRARALRQGSLRGRSPGSPERRLRAFVRGAAASDAQAGSGESVSDLTGFGVDRLRRVIDHCVPIAAWLEDLSRARRIGIDEKSIEKGRKRMTAFMDFDACRAIACARAAGPTR